MLVKTYAAAVHGITATVITIEVSCSKGIHFFLVGLPDNAVKESHERIVSALQMSGYQFPRNRIVVNMAPADIRKEGSAYDLPLAVGILAGAEVIGDAKLSQYMMMGELSLDGSLQPIKGALPIAIKAKEEGFKGIVLPEQNCYEAAVVEGLEVRGARNIKEVVEFFNGKGGIEPVHIDSIETFFSSQQHFDIDFSEVRGQENVKRALEIAAAGGHNIIMV
ncbi:MAG: ATP-binding protein, partial [Tannerella sp.]|nr:ATP-binding protein [Tannerella sp.]